MGVVCALGVLWLWPGRDALSNKCLGSTGQGVTLGHFPPAVGLEALGGNLALKALKRPFLEIN